ncbi:MAG: MtnX-like HAD-IB family phosphatase [Bacteroidota bacterium]
MSGRTFKIFVDFDGTITKQDIGESMFLKFGSPVKAQTIIDDWINKKINAKQSWQLLCDTIENFDKTAFDQFLNSIRTDNTFIKFTEFCFSNRFELRVLSDGLDYYINNILKRENLLSLEVFSNQLMFDDKKLIPVFPHTDEECDRCANCKRNHILNCSSDEDFSVYIGDGWSDFCPAQYCDFIFAKNSLLKYCEVNRITYFPFSNFDDVVTRLIELKGKKKLQKRHQAKLKRQEIYKQG